MEISPIPTTYIQRTDNKIFDTQEYKKLYKPKKKNFKNSSISTRSQPDPCNKELVYFDRGNSQERNKEREPKLILYSSNVQNQFQKIDRNQFKINFDKLIQCDKNGNNNNQPTIYFTII